MIYHVSKSGSDPNPGTQELPFLPVKMHRKNEAVKTSFPRLLLLLRKPVMCVPAFSLLYNLSIFNHLLQ